MRLHLLSYAACLLAVSACASDSAKKSDTAESPINSATDPRDASTSESDDDMTSDVDAPVGMDNNMTPGNDGKGVVSCGTKSSDCDLSKQACCVTGFGADAAKCEDGSSCKNGNPTPCDGPEECPAGNSCCVSPVQGTTSCKTACGSFDVQLCHADNQCPAGKKCSQSTTFTWWGTCK